MKLLRAYLTGIFTLAAGAAAVAGPCAQEIVKTQARIDAALESQAAAGKPGKEVAAATAHRQPTPESIAAAEKALGEGVSIQAALDALERARTADARGDAALCEKAVADARKAMRE
jgi:hypothetical protein